jgi:3-oxoacyl-[acyl-carrier-protein] synthase-1
MDVANAFTLAHMTCACALGRTHQKILDAYAVGVAPGMREISGDIPGRSIFFGMVPGELPRIGEREFDMRACRLLLQAAEDMRTEFSALVERYSPERVAVVLGASNTGMDEAQNCVDGWLEAGAEPASLGMDFSRIELGTPADYLARLLGAKGPAYVVSTACSSSAKAFASARRLVAIGAADAAVVGGVDGRCRFAMNGFHALGALSQGRCRPLAPDRDGINLGEGVALFTMERLSDARPGGVLLAGCGESSDAYHATAPEPEGRGAEAAMRAALEDAGIAPEDVGYVNLHGTGTQANDDMEMRAVERVFGPSPRAKVESTKNLTGHCLGAAGAVEAAVCWLLLESGRVDGAAMSNSFAFGGSNASVVLAKENAWAMAR